MKKRRLKFFNGKLDILSNKTVRKITISMIVLIFLSSLMIVSADMGPVKGEYLVGEVAKTIFKQIIIVAVGLFFYFIFLGRDLFKYGRNIYMVIAVAMIVFLAGTRLFATQSIGGAYAWYNLGFFTLQASEVCKVFDILFIASIFAFPDRRKDGRGGKYDYSRIWLFIFIYTVIIVFLQKDLGSGIILFGMAYFAMLAPYNREYTKIQKFMKYLMFGGIILILFVISPVGIKFIDSLGINSYMIERITVIANPFEKRFDSGYHLVMSLVSFATGGLFGLGYGNSTHKYMNFPNPDSDFILPVIVEECGFLGFAVILVLYYLILSPIIRYAFNKYADNRSRTVLVGVSMYFILHFILNVGGVTGLIPLTGVPILLVSYGGTQTVTSMCAIAFAQNEIARIKKKASDQ